MRRDGGGGGGGGGARVDCKLYSIVMKLFKYILVNCIVYKYILVNCAV